MFAELEKIERDYLDLGLGLTRDEARELAIREYKIKKEFEEDWAKNKKKYKPGKKATSSGGIFAKNNERILKAKKASLSARRIKKLDAKKPEAKTQPVKNRRRGRPPKTSYSH